MTGLARPTKVPEVWETAEKVEFAGQDSVGTKSRRPYGPSKRFGGVVEGNLLRRNGPRNPAADFFSGLVDEQHNPNPS
jgi:hypothetical protein